MLPSLIFLLILISALLTYVIYMPGDSFQGKLPPLDEADTKIAARLEIHVAELCTNLAGRNFIEKKGLDSAKEYIADQFRSYGFQIAFQEYDLSGEVYANIEAELR